MLIKVENETLARDVKSNAVVETDIKKLHRHRALKRAMEEKDEKLHILMDKLNKIEQTIERIINNG